MKNNSSLLSSLEELAKNPNSRLIVSGDGGWFSFQSFAVSIRALSEAATNVHLRKENHISDEKREFLLKAGYSPRRSNRSIGKMITIGEEKNRKKVAEET